MANSLTWFYSIARFDGREKTEKAPRWAPETHLLTKGAKKEDVVLPMVPHRIDSGYSAMNRTSSRSDSKSVARVVAWRTLKESPLREPVCTT